MTRQLGKIAFVGGVIRSVFLVPLRPCVFLVPAMRRPRLPSPKILLEFSSMKMPRGTGWC